MKQVHASYTFVASTKTITLTGLNIDQDQLLLIVNATRGVQYFNFADSSLRGVVTSGANTTVVLTDASTTGHSNSDALVIYYDDQVASQAVTGTVTANPGTGAFTVSGTVGLDPASLSALENVTVTIGSSVTVSGTVAAHVVGYDEPNDSFTQIRVQQAGEGISPSTPILAVGIANENGGISESNPLPVTANVPYVRVLPVSAILNLGGDPESNPEVIFGGYYKYAGNNTWKKICEADRGGSPEISIIKYGNGWRVVCNLEGAVGYIFAIENFKNFPEGTFDADGELFGEFTIGSSFIVTLEQPTTQPISGTVTVGNSITIGSLPVQLSTTTIGGTARLNVTLSSATTLGATVPSYGNLYGGSDGTNFRAINVDSSGRTVVTGSVSVANLPSTQTVAGTVTANISGTVPVSGTFWQTTQPVSGTVTANVSGTVPVSGTFWQATQPVSLASLPSSTVTVAAMPSGALTTRFGSVTTANTAQLTAAVTNSSRKFLLVQNIATSTVTIGIGFAPTTTQGIQLAAGAGLTFDAFCPTGGVWWLSGTTGANWSVLEG